MSTDAVLVRELAFLAAVDAEVSRARAKFPGQEFDVPLTGWLAILVEEVGEVARDLNELTLGDDSAERRANLLTELEQVGAMACMMTNAVKAQWTEPGE